MNNKNITNDDFSLLRNREIIDILIGGQYMITDTDDTDKFLPYLNGKSICEISTKFGLVVIYGEDQNLSRWKYMDNLIEFCISNGKIGNLLSYLFNLKQFSEKLKGYSPDEIQTRYNEIVNYNIDKINGALVFSGKQLVVYNHKFYIQDTNTNIVLEVPSIKKIDREYIKSITSRAFEDIELSNYDSAITKTRTLLEEVFCYVIEQKGEIATDSGNIVKLYSQVQDLYHMHQNKELDKRINELLGGINKIITSIAEMRNKDSDAHGVGVKRIAIQNYHARLFVNSSATLADFILSVYEAHK